MKKFINHVDHVAWISSPETLDANVALLEKLTGAKLQRFERKDMGFVMCISWEAGLEIVSPMREPSAFNVFMHERLATRGDSVTAIVFGVRDLEKHKEKLEALGVPVGQPLDDHPDSPWHHKLVLRERHSGERVMDTGIVLGQIDYADGVIPFEDAHDQPRMKKLVNHIDHVAWVSSPATIAANRAALEQISGVKLEYFRRKDAGLDLYINWESGLEIICPTPEVTDFNQALHDHLKVHGDSVFATVFGVRDMEKHKTRLERLGVEVGPMVDDHPDSPWHHKLILRERMVGMAMKSNFVLGDIDYADGVITMENV